MFASLFALDSFHRLLSTQLTADLTLEWSGGSMFHPLSHLCKNSFLLRRNSFKKCSELSTRFWLTVSKCGTHFQHSFLIDKCSCKMVNALPSDIFNSSAIAHNFNLYVVLGWMFSLSVEPGIEPGIFRFQSKVLATPLPSLRSSSTFLLLSLSLSFFFSLSLSLSVLLLSFLFHLLSCFCFSPRKSDDKKNESVFIHVTLPIIHFLSL